jgi:hypothetical protein
MHSQIPENLIKQALEIHKENTRLVRLAANRNFAEYWFTLHTNPEDIKLQTQLGIMFGREFKNWWLDLYDKTKRITEIRGLFDRDVIPGETLLEYGAVERPYDNSLGPHGMDPAEWNLLDARMRQLAQYLYVWIFRVSMSGDRTNYVAFLGRNPSPVNSSSSSTSSPSMSSEQILEKAIPQKLFDEYQVSKPNDPFVQSYAYIKREVTAFFVRAFSFSQEGKIARGHFLQQLNPNKFDFDEYWNSLPSRYANVPEIVAILDKSITLSPASTIAVEKLSTLGTSAGSQEADSDEIKKTLEALINKIREIEVESLQENLVKIYGNIAKVTRPFLEFYNTSTKLMGGIGSLSGGQDTYSGRRRF